MKFYRGFVAATAGFCLAGCMVGPDYRTPTPDMPGGFSSSVSQTQPASRLSAATARAIDIDQWWQSLGDPELDSLVQRAVIANPDLEIALTRLQQARIEESVITGVTLPAVDMTAGAGRGSGTNSARGRVGQAVYAGSNTTGLKEVTHIIGFDSGWELDLFGKYRREAEAARADTEVAGEARNSVLVVLVSDVARAYLDVRALQVRLAIARNDVDTETQSVHVVQSRFDRGLTNELDVALASRELATVQSQVAPLEAEVEAAKQRVAVLLGRFPHELDMELTAPAPLPDPPEKVQPDLPVALLRRRPDIRQAERELAAATARIGIATANLFPAVGVTAGAGLQGQGLGRTPNNSMFIWSAGPTAYWPLLDFGTLDSLVTIQDLRTREASLNYRKVILNAVREVNDAVNNFIAQQNRVQFLAKALVASQRAVDLASQRYERGLTDFLNLLDAQRQFYVLQDQYAQARQQVSLQFVVVYKSLGGGWNTFAPAGAPPPARPAIIAAADRLLHPARQNGP